MAWDGVTIRTTVRDDPRASSRFDEPEGVRVPTVRRIAVSSATSRQSAIY
jgi:hypothetical protein